MNLSILSIVKLSLIHRLQFTHVIHPGARLGSMVPKRVVVKLVSKQNAELKLEARALSRLLQFES